MAKPFLSNISHGLTCPCSAQKNIPYFNRGTKSIEQNAIKQWQNQGYPQLNYIRPKHTRLVMTTPLSKDEKLADYAFEMATSNIRYGHGVTREVGFDLIDLGAKNVAIFADPNLFHLKGDNAVSVVLQSLEDAKLKFKVFHDIGIEPTDSSFKRAIEFASLEKFDAFVAVGGGSTMDTAKAANLYSTYPTDDFLDYVSPPIGKGKAPPGPVKPLIAVPTTAGTGSETTGVAICDLEEFKYKVGIAHRTLRPILGIVDPHNTKTMPANVAAASGFDVLCHSLESYTALPYDKRVPRPETPKQRPTYQGANPISDFWSLKALEMTSQFLRRAFKDTTDEKARSQMLLAATFAGIGFGNAGVHLCHGMSYPISGLAHDLNFHPSGYPKEKSLVPHGMSVVLNAPAVFKFTAPSDPIRHRTCAEILGINVSKTRDEDIGNALSDGLLTLMKDLEIPNGLSAIGYNESHISALVEGTLPQHRVTKLSPRPVGREELTKLFEATMTLY